MKAYFVTLLVVDHDGVGSGVKEIIENTKYPNRCINPRVIDLLEADIGEWDDDHPLNERDKGKEIIRQSYEWIKPCN